MRSWLLLLAATAAFAQLRTDSLQFTGAGLPPKHLVATFDDGVSSPDPAEGKSQTQLIAELLNQAGILGTFFQVGCHFAVAGNPGKDPLGTTCLNGDTHPIDIDQYLVGLGHIIGNHTWYHVPLTLIESDAARVTKHVKLMQQLIGPFQPDGLHLFRAPGLAFDPKVAAILNADPLLADLTGPVGMDTDAIGSIYGQQFAGDYDWFAKGKKPEDCADFYYQQIQKQCSTHGCVVLIHDRSDAEIHTDWAYKLTKRLMAEIGSDYRWTPPDAIPGILGATRLDAPSQWTPEFGTDDGVGAIVLGDIAKKGVPAACKARADMQIWCALPGTPVNGIPVLQPSTPWLSVNDQEWAKLGQRFWLADVNGDGRDDVIWATYQGLWTALSDGRAGFGEPRLWSGYFSEGNGWDVRTLLEGIRFGHFYGPGPGPEDLLIATPQGLVTAKNFGRDLGPSLIWSPYVPSHDGLLTMQVRDLDGDGLDDLLIRDETLGKVLVFTAKSDGWGGAAFAAPKTWLDLAGQTNLTAWNDPDNGSTVKLARFGKRLLLTAGAPTGIVYAPPATGAVFSPAWRHLCNTCLTTLTDWHPERQASGIVWSDLTGGGSDWAVLTRKTGVEIARGIDGGN